MKNNPVRALKRVMKLPLGSKVRAEGMILNNWAVDKVFSGPRQQKIENLNSAMRLMKEIRKHEVNGMVYIQVWGRDCDQCESTSMSSCKATRSAYEAFENDIWEHAEGPQRLTIVSAEDASEFKASFRDRAAEMMNY
jgi:hypothetical protein